MKSNFRRSVIYEDNHLLIVNKPAGLLVQGDRTGDETLADQAKAYIKDKYKKPGDVFLGIIHRLDRPVSGAVILARTSKGLERMNELFKEREVKKTYWAVIGNKPPQISGELVHWLKKDTKINKATAFNKNVKGAQKAELDYELIGRIANNYLLEINLRTGKPHQIRVQLAKIGCPVMGDVKYGYDKPNSDAAIHLHSREIQFTHPVKKEPVQITAKLPQEQIWDLFDS